MATRQYIGARYVPKFYQNSVDGSAQWESNVVYEPLTFVTLTNGHIYLSKKQVPATVGTPASNVEYWLDAGDYNGQIAQLQDEIDALNANKIAPNVASLLTRTDLAVGDIVYVAGYYVAGDGGDGTFIIEANSNGFNHRLNNGLYANNIDNDWKLPRYGGYYVNEMLDNARPYMVAHQWKHIILPQASAKHQGCGSYTENSKTIYFWQVNHPIVYDETLAYSINDFYGEISLAADATDKEAIIKISDANKPEDIYFNGQLMLQGYHFNNNFNYVENVLLVEGSARLNIQNLHASWCDNCITLGGDNALNPVHVHVDFAEIGSCREYGIFAKNTNVTTFNCNNLVFENALAGCKNVIYGEGAMFNWHIGDVQCTTLGNATNLESVHFKLSGITGFETALIIDAIRAAANATNNITLEGTSGVLKIGYAVLVNSSSTITIENKSTAGCINIDSLETRGQNYNIDTSNSTNGIIIITSASTTGVRTETGSNIRINDIVNSPTAPMLRDALILRSDLSPAILQVKNNNITYNV